MERYPTFKQRELGEAAKKQKLAEIEASPIYGGWIDDEGDCWIHLELPHGCHYGGGMYKPKFRNNELRSYMLYVPPELRGAGIGERLMRCLVASAKEEQQADLFILNVESQYTVDILGRVFGENLSFVDTSRGEMLPMSNQEAYLSLQRAEEFETSLESRAIGFFVEINLNEIDTTGWELPVIDS